MTKAILIGVIFGAFLSACAETVTFKATECYSEVMNIGGKAHEVLVCHRWEDGK